MWMLLFLLTVVVEGRCSRLNEGFLAPLNVGSVRAEISVHYQVKGNIRVD